MGVKWPTIFCPNMASGRLTMWYQGLIGHSAAMMLLLLVVFLHLTTVSVTVYLHRYSAHRALELKPAIQHLFRFWLWLTTGMSTKAWTAIHRKHHANCETGEDPHSPVILGLNTVLWRGTELYQAADTESTRSKYGKGTPDDWIERHLYRHSAIGISLMLIIDLLLFGAIGITLWAVQMAWIPFTAAGVINGVGHAWGYRNFECPDASRNILPWGVLIGGEELHNNHHTYPNSPKLSVKWWEFDIGWMWICLLKMLGLAKVDYRGPVAKRVPGKQLIDLDTAWATLNDRFQIMARYSTLVVKPLIKLEKEQADRAGRALLRKARKFICREQALVGERAKKEMSRLWASHPNLEQIYKMRRSLQAIWQHRAQNAQGMMHALQAWCQEAEDSGIQALHDFSYYIRSYSMPSPAS